MNSFFNFNYQFYCHGKLFVFKKKKDDAEKFESVFTLDTNPIDGIQLYNQTTAFVDDPFSFQLKYTLKIEALPMEYLIINGESLKTAQPCVPSTNTLNCLTSKGTLDYKNKTLLENVDFELSYGFNADLCFQNLNLSAKAFAKSINIFCKQIFRFD